MTREFTGERVIPGLVDVNLWNEHAARYAFASRLSRNRRVLDLGCGTGYGSAELAASARSVAGVDISTEALEYGTLNYSRTKLQWVQASASSLPFRDATFDLVVAFEVIEHLRDWKDLLAEARRVLATSGQLVISTPNKTFYAESRRSAGPNPFHEHEFEFEEFRDELGSFFPFVSLFVQDHIEGVVFRGVPARATADVRLEPGAEDPRESNFFLAVCAMSEQMGTPTFVYLPHTGNLLGQRLEHISRLEGELRQKDQWLGSLQKDHASLVEAHSNQIAELESSNRWAEQLEAQLNAAGARVIELQEEAEAQQREATAAIAQLHAELERRTDAFTERSSEADRLGGELGRAVELLDRAERTVKERTQWARSLEKERDQLQAELAKVRASRWIRLGRALGIGPELHSS